ncbi:adhesion G-protein coupled receptor D1-like [Glandiceps talaboti]
MTLSTLFCFLLTILESFLAAVAIYYKNVRNLSLTNTIEDDKSKASENDIASDVIAGSVIYCGQLVPTAVMYSLLVEIDGNEKNEEEEDGEEGEDRFTCVYLDINVGTGECDWLTTGCQLVTSDGATATCYCNHTTNFAVMLQVVPFEVSSINEKVLSYIGYVGGAISAFSLLVGLSIYMKLRSLLRSERIVIHLNLMVVILIVQIILLISKFWTDRRWYCRTVAVSLHYFSTVMFFWMLIEGVQLYRQVVVVYGSEKSWLGYYCFIAWGVPAIIVGVTASSRWTDYASYESCWLSAENGLIWVFAATVIIVVTVNFIVLFLVVRIVYKASKLNKVSADSIRASLKSALLLLPLLGVTWIIGFFAVNNDTIVFTYIFTTLNSLQGFFLFLCYIAINSEVHSAYRRMKEVSAAEAGELSFTQSKQSTGQSMVTKNISTLTRQSTKETTLGSAADLG